MASLRSTTRIARPADEVWKVVSDPAGISAWFPGIEQATAGDGTRSCTLAGGHQLEEDGPDGALVVYSTEIAPDSLADMIGPSIDGGVQGLKAHLEASS